MTKLNYPKCICSFTIISVMKYLLYCYTFPHVIKQYVIIYFQCGLNHLKLQFPIHILELVFKCIIFIIFKLCLEGYSANHHNSFCNSILYYMIN